MIKYLYYPLSVHSFFHESGHICQRHLLMYKVFSTLCSDPAGNSKHHKNDHYCKYRKKRTQHQHGNKSYNNCKQCHQCLWNCLADHLSQCICIIGIKTHDRTICILVEVTDWQCLHMFKHIITYSFEYTLSNINHHSCVNKCCNDTCQKDYAQNSQGLIKSCKIRGFLSNKRQDKIIQKVSQRKRDCSCRHSTDQDTEENKNKLEFIFLCHIFHQTFCRL